jgi:hypothetical protein
VAMKKALSKVGSVLRVTVGIVWCVADLKGYYQSHYTKEELDQMGVNFDHQ